MLEKAFVVYRVGGFSRNLRSEITKMERWYFFDNGILNAVAGMLNPLDMRNDAGALWENWIMAERLKHLSATGESPRRYFWRTYAQQEIDSVEDGGGRLAAWEFKWGRKQPRVPGAWKRAYPEASFGVVSPENFMEFIT